MMKKKQNIAFHTVLLANTLRVNIRIDRLKKILLISLFLGMGCATVGPDNDNCSILFLDYHSAEKVHFEDFFDLTNMSVISFSSEQRLLLTEHIQIRISQNNIFLLDKGYSQLYRFDRSGNFLNLIGRPGLGPSEYFNPAFFALDIDMKQVDVLCNNGSSIMTFDYNGHFVKQIETPLIISSFDRLSSNDYFYYTGFFNSENFKRLHRADTSRILESFLPIKTQAFDMVEMNFTPMDSYGYFRETFFPSIYKYDQNGIEELFRINFGRCQITQEMLEMAGDPYEFFEKISRDGFCSTVSLVAGDNTFYVVIIEQEKHSTQVSHLYAGFGDTVSKRVVNKSKDQHSGDFFSQLKPIELDSEGRVVFLTNSLELTNFIRERYGFLPYLPIIEENTNPLIIMIPLNRL